ncbi:MAG: PEGA domain-containing protein [Caldisericia bacterium]|nr:PEGA domain-containing protein [Caldisericia bacterium]
MTDRPTVWEPIATPQDFNQKPSNPKLRIWAMIVGLVLMLGFVIYVTFLPRQYEYIINIDSNPQGAKLYINDEIRGTTPLKLSLPPSSYTLKLEKETFNTLTTNIDVIKDNEVFKFDLTNQEDSVYITTIPEGAMVFVDETFVGLSNLKYKRDLENIHKVKVSLQGFRPQERTIDFSQERDIIFNLDKSFYDVNIKTNPQGAVVYIDEIYKGETPMTVQLPEGDHSLRLVLSGRKSILKTVKVQTPLDLDYSFDDEGFFFDTMIGRESAPGAKVYLFHLDDNLKVNSKIPPLFVGKTPITRSVNDIMTYLTTDLKTKKALIVANHQTLGATMRIIDFDPNISNKQDYILQLSGLSPMLTFGQPIEGIDFNSIITDTEIKFQDLDNNLRFKEYSMNGSYYIIDRDNYPKGTIQLKEKPEKKIISPDEKFLVTISKSKASLINMASGKELLSQSGTYAYFTTDSKFAVIYNRSQLVKIDLGNLSKETKTLTINGKLIPMSQNLAIETDKGKITGIVDFEYGKKTSWNEIFTENPLEPQYVLISNIAGTDNVLVIGKLCGVNVMIKAEGNPMLIYFWVPENAILKVISPNL